MSGGSFLLLCTTHVDELLQNMEPLDEMCTHLTRTEYAGDAAEETARIAADIRSFHVDIEKRLEKIRPVWEAFEYWYDGDWSEDAFKESLQKWRGRNDL